MKSFEKYFMEKNYARVEELGDKLAEIDPLIDWEVFRPIIREMYDNHTERGGRPNNDEIIMMKMLVLQSWYGSVSYTHLDVYKRQVLNMLIKFIQSSWLNSEISVFIACS